MNKWTIAIVGILLVALGVFIGVHKVSPISWGMWGNYNTSSGLALKGFDPVVYFEDASATLGSDQLSVEWGEATWRFTSAENLSLFQKNPQDYAPQFGGFCSFAVSKGFTADASPEAWHINDGKLYLFADENVRAEWVAGIAEGTLRTSIDNWKKR